MDAEADSLSNEKSDQNFMKYVRPLTRAERDFLHARTLQPEVVYPGGFRAPAATTQHLPSHYNTPSPERLQRAYEYWGWTGCVVPDCTGQPRLHHIVPRREGGSDGSNNLLPICAAHEAAVHKAGAEYRRMTGAPYGERPKRPGKKKRLGRKGKIAAGIPPTPRKKHREPDARTVHEKRNAEIIKRAANKSHAALAGFRYGCYDCRFEFTERPPYCGTCKKDGKNMCFVKASSPTLRSDYEPGRITSIEGKVISSGKKVPSLSLEEEHAKFERMQRERSKKHGKKFYQYGKSLSTNMAAPFIARLRAEIERGEVDTSW